MMVLRSIVFSAVEGLLLSRQSSVLFSLMTEKATLAAGCFWGVEESFRSSGKVLTTKVGYTGGTTVDPSYKDVCTGTTGHAETVEVTFDPTKTQYAELLNLFWTIHDPTTLNRQGPDHGTQYRSAIFFHSSQQEKIAKESLTERQKHLNRPIVTQIVAAGPFYDAEEYHQQYIWKKKGSSACGRH